MRVLLAGILGGIAMFVWSSIAHLATPLASEGISVLPDEQVTINSFAASLGERHGLFLFPTMGTATATGAKSGPTGFLVYHPHGAYALNPRTLITEFITEVIESLIAAFLVSMAAIASYGTRVGFVALVGLAAAITTNIPYWNWYGFPGRYTAGYALTELIAYVVAGLVIAWLVPKKA